MSCKACEKDKKKAYTMQSMVIDATISLVAALKNAASKGQISAPPEMIEKRQDICKACQYRASNRCSRCGCYISFKTALEHEKCPVGFW